ncbi:hypothetical protein B566_EDAN005893 [Ephemera danica]|nr:hypothetical protein B566_EDAN005893 [Ephemera danica]
MDRHGRYAGNKRGSCTADELQGQQALDRMDPASAPYRCKHVVVACETRGGTPSLSSVRVTMLATSLLMLLLLGTAVHHADAAASAPAPVTPAALVVAATPEPRDTQADFIEDKNN